MTDLLAKTMHQNPNINGYLLLDSLVTTTGISTIRCIDVSTPLFSGFQKMRIISNPDEVSEKFDYFSRLKYLSKKVVYPSGPLFLEEGEFHGCPYFVEKYVWGKQLLTVHRSLKAQDREFGVGFSTLIAYRVARILQAVSRRTLVSEPSDMLLHGMLTPKNVVIGYDGEVFVVNY